MDLINWQEPSLHRTAALIIAIPLSWNIIARSEYRNKTVSKIFGRFVGWALLAASIFSISSLRTYWFNDAMEHQPTSDVLDSIPFIDEISYALFAFGGILVLGSYYRLGIRHTYLGDYFGYLMDERVTGFPFNVLDNPMYWGATIEYLSMALWARSPAGLLLTAVVYVVYWVAIQFEGPFTAQIYANRDKKQ